MNNRNRIAFPFVNTTSTSEYVVWGVRHVCSRGTEHAYEHFIQLTTKNIDEVPYELRVKARRLMQLTLARNAESNLHQEKSNLQ